jgi:hypothetical protein
MSSIFDIFGSSLWMNTAAGPAWNDDQRAREARRRHEAKLEREFFEGVRTAQQGVFNAFHPNSTPRRTDADAVALAPKGERVNCRVIGDR